MGLINALFSLFETVPKKNGILINAVCSCLLMVNLKAPTTPNPYSIKTLALKPETLPNSEPPLKPKP